MKKYEKDLKKLIKLSDGGSNFVHQENTGMNKAELRFLQAKGLVSFRPAGDNELYIVVESAGLTYFSNKHEQRIASAKQTIRDICMFLSGVLVTVLAELIMRVLL